MGARIGCRDAGHGFEPGGRGVYTRLLVDDTDPQQHNFLMELVDNPAGLRAINRADWPSRSVPMWGQASLDE